MYEGVAGLSRDAWYARLPTSPTLVIMRRPRVVHAHDADHALFNLKILKRPLVQDTSRNISKGGATRPERPTVVLLVRLGNCDSPVL